MIHKGDVVRAFDWPATAGKRFRVIRVSRDGFAQVRDLGGAGKLRMIEVDYLAVDALATRLDKAGSSHVLEAGMSSHDGCIAFIDEMVARRQQLEGIDKAAAARAEVAQHKVLGCSDYRAAYVEGM